MMHPDLHSENYWDERYAQKNTPWDIGYANPGLLQGVRECFEPSSFILFPGSGTGYEAGELYREGFKNVFICDWSSTAVSNMHDHYPEFPPSRILVQDFFTMEGKFDGIVEQTFLCALPIAMRRNYVEHCANLLKPGGLFIGVLFDRIFPDPGPPFGGSIEEYRALFEPYFDIDLLTPWTDSIPPRAGTECFIRCSPKLKG